VKQTIITAVMSHARRELRVHKPHRELMCLKGVANINAVTVIYYYLRNRHKVRFRNIRKHASVYKHGRTSLKLLKGDENRVFQPSRFTF
jgi:hypothetical protein